MDFKEPVSPLVALAIVSAVQVPKGLVRSS